MTTTPPRARLLAALLPLAFAAALIVAGLAASGCGNVARTDGGGDAAPAAADTTEAGYRARIARLEADLDAAIGQARATDAARCRVVAVGAKGCGGPRAYRVYSAADSDAARVEALAAEVTRVEAEMNRRFQIASDCAMAEAPAVALEGGRCVAR